MRKTILRNGYFSSVRCMPKPLCGTNRFKVRRREQKKERMRQIPFSL
jgi:hypothetical protein